MHFCKICKNMYDIVEINDKSKQLGGASNQFKEIINKILDKEQIDHDVLAKINLKELQNNEFFKTKTSNEKEEIYNTILHYQENHDNQESKENSHYKIYFHCTNCGFQEKIKPQTLLFSNVIDKIDQVLDEDLSHLLDDNTLPRTFDYVCKNKNCPSHKDPSKREALFFRHGKTYMLTYLCVECKNYWNI